MRSAIKDLAQLPDRRLFEEIAIGIRHIVENAESLESVAVRLAKMKEHRACGIIRSLVEEEAAKVLILLDVVRCPKGERNGRTRALNSCYSHLAKRIYAEACSWRPSNFYDLEQYIDLERREYYLDGPNDVDWIFLYDAKAERERRMYVDYVQDVTEQDGERYWVFPTATTSGERHDEHDTPTCLCMVRALHRVGGGSAPREDLVGRLDALHSYKRLKSMIRDLTLEEGMDLAALAWFGKLRQSGWTACHQNARKTIGDDLNYECGLGAHWLSGYERWEKVPELPANLTSGLEMP